MGAWSYLDVPDPQKGEQGFPRLLIENRAYATRAFRKLHLELAHRQDGLQVPPLPRLLSSVTLRRGHSCAQVVTKLPEGLGLPFQCSLGNAAHMERSQLLIYAGMVVSVDDVLMRHIPAKLRCLSSFRSAAWR